MVACAHLKTLSRKEVESLSTAKKGWKKSSSKTEAETAAMAARILEEERQKAELESNNRDSIESNSKTVNKVLSKAKGHIEKCPKPKSFLEMERMIDKMSSSVQKLRFFVLPHSFIRNRPHEQTYAL